MNKVVKEDPKDFIAICNVLTKKLKGLKKDIAFEVRRGGIFDKPKIVVHGSKEHIEPYAKHIEEVVSRLSSGNPNISFPVVESKTHEGEFEFEVERNYVELAGFERAASTFRITVIKFGGIM